MACGVQAALDLFTRSFPLCFQEKAVAVGVSGGPDSMALVHALADYCTAHGGPSVTALTVDHGLRPESADEARQVKTGLSAIPGVLHRVLVWEGDKPAAAVQEAARSARYALMEDYCAQAGIRYLFLAHHQDDQAETLLMRLAAGSGLDGLSGMAPLQQAGGITLARPFLEISKIDLLVYCHEHDISYVNDPSNALEKYARVRLRKSAEILEREGLSAKRLALTAKRLARARMALEAAAQSAYEDCLAYKNTDRIVFLRSPLRGVYEETVFRIFRKVLSEWGGDSAYGPRTERVESLVADFLQPGPFRKRTLGGVIISVDEKRDELVFEKEGGKKP